MNNTVFRLRHCYGDGRGLEVKYLGIFSTDLEALEAIEWLKAAPGFKDYPDSFIITEEKLDTVNWDEVITGINKLNTYIQSRSNSE